MRTGVTKRVERLCILRAARTARGNSLLLESGANVNVYDKAGRSPLSGSADAMLCDLLVVLIFVYPTCDAETLIFLKVVD